MVRKISPKWWRRIGGFLLVAGILSASSYIGHLAISAQVSQTIIALNITPDWHYTQLSSSMWRTPPIVPEGFLFEVQVMNYTPFMQDIVNRSVLKYGLGNITRHWQTGELGEWDYSFLNLKDGAMDGSGRVHYGGFPTPPANRSEALGVMRNYVLNIMEGETRPWASFNGHYPFHHYAGEWGFDAIGSEIGENIHNYQLQLAFNRGAARQYGKPWFVDVSAWFGGGITDYSAAKPWGEYSGPDNGHSLSLYRRTYFTSYMAGTSALIAEASGVNFFLQELDGTNCFLPSPLGLVGQEFYNFTQRHPDPGIPYTPFGLLLDYYHGTYSGHNDRKAFDYFPYDSGDLMSWTLENMFFPGCWDISQEKTALTSSPFGDTCDVLLQDANQTCLATYPILVPTGSIIFTKTEIQQIVKYVTEGGVLLLNRAYANQFPANFLNAVGTSTIFEPVRTGVVGNGTLILWGPDWWPDLYGNIIFKELARKVLPFSVDGEVEYQINRDATGWVLTLVNNKGVTKDSHAPPVIDPTAKRSVHITYTGGGTVTAITNWLTDVPLSSIPTDDQGRPSFSVEIEPGDLIIYKYAVTE